MAQTIRVEEAAYTLKNLPEKDRPRGYGNTSSLVVHDAKHAYGYTPKRPMRIIPSAAAISRMEECFDWLLMLNPEDARIVWLRAEGARWRQVCIRVRFTAWRSWVAALLTISKKLEKLDKSKGKGKGAKPLTAITRTTPRESGAATSDNWPDPSNFGRDTFLGFDA